MIRVLLIALLLLPTAGYAAPPYRYYLSPIIGSGMDPNPYRVALSSVVSQYSSVIPSNANGTPRYAWGLVYTPETSAPTSPTTLALPLRSMTDPLGLTTIERASLRAALGTRGITITLSASMTFASLVEVVGTYLDSSFSTESLFAGQRAITRGQTSTVLFADTFTNAAVSISTSGSDYGLWKTKDGLFSVASNQLVYSSTVTPGVIVNLTSLSTANYYVAATGQHGSITANGENAILGRMSDSPSATLNAYRASDVSNDTLLLFTKYLNGVATQFSTWTKVNNTSPHRIVLGMIGSRISVRWDDLVSAVRPFEVMATTDSDIGASGYGGFRVNGAQSGLDAFQEDDFCIATTTAEADVNTACVVTSVTAPGVVVGEPSIY